MSWDSTPDILSIGLSTRVWNVAGLAKQLGLTRDAAMKFLETIGATVRPIGPNLFVDATHLEDCVRAYFGKPLDEESRLSDARYYATTTRDRIIAHLERAVVSADERLKTGRRYRKRTHGLLKPGA